MYTVHMKRVTATEARKSWFKLLDEVADGEVVVVERRGRRLVIRCEDGEADAAAGVPDYRGMLKATHADQADRWGWDWAAGELVPTEREP
ncbi:MAG: hypothetical protein JXR96_30580 [Deltaproteobacteria bacterium]|nr:hypothetical protein [Deltaproteobacteria bacterium]